MEGYCQPVVVSAFACLLIKLPLTVSLVETSLSKGRMSVGRRALYIQRVGHAPEMSYSFLKTDENDIKSWASIAEVLPTI